jgi:hypothetical protein
LREQVLSFVEGAVLIGYNTSFDLQFLNHAFDGAFIGAEYIDLLPIVRRRIDLPNYHLETVAAYVKFEPEGGYHDSLTDCMATSAIYYRLGLQNFPDLIQFFHPALSNDLNKVRSKYVNRSTSQLPTKDFLNDYLPNGQDYFEVTYTANIQGVSYNYEGNTRKIISGLPIGSPLTLRLWPDSPDDDHAICVFTPDSKQIGYLSLPDNWNPINAELRKQMQFGIPFTATVAEKGIVQDTDIWWCRVEIKYNVPYPRGSSMTYINSFGGAYHARRGCCHAEWEVPMYWAEKCAMHPCKRCHKAENK